MRRKSDEMEERGQGKEAAFWMRGGGATLRRVSEGGEWWEKGEWGELREKGEEGVFERGEREAWREKSVMVALRGRGEGWIGTEVGKK